MRQPYARDAGRRRPERVAGAGTPDRSVWIWSTVTVNHLASNVPARNLDESLGFVKCHEILGFRRSVTSR